MKKSNSVAYVITLSNGLSIDDLPLTDRSDRWWDMFWNYIGIAEAQRLREKV